MKNCLSVANGEFKDAIKPFGKKRLNLDDTLVAFEGGFLIIESGGITAVMHATGEWHGRATFSKNALIALATVPPSQDPIVVEYDNSKIKFGNLSIPCNWELASQKFIEKLANPDLIDLLAMERTLPRAQLGRSGLGPHVKAAREKMERRIGAALKQLADLGVSEDEIRDLVEEKIQMRIDEGRT
jgi:hypothetical protein